MSAKVKPGNTWKALASPTAAIEPANKLAALKAIAASLPENAPYRLWFAHAVTLYAASTGSSFAHVLGLKRSGVPAPHTVEHLEARDTHIRHIARVLPHASPTEKAHRIAAIIRLEEKAPSARVDHLVQVLRELFPGDIPTSERTYERILEGGAQSEPDARTT